MAKVRALSLTVYANPRYRKCANGGWTEENDELYVACPDGPWEVEEDDPALFRLGHTMGALHLEPYARRTGAAGPMMGGSYAGTSDGRFSRLCERVAGTRFYGAVAVHDRYESWSLYEALSR